MLANLGGVSTFRCGGCGRALKVPAQFRGDSRPTGPGSRPEGPADRTQAMPKVRPATPPAAIAGTPPVAARPPEGTVLPRAAAAPDLHPPLILRLALWVIALPLGSLIVFMLASTFGILTKNQLEDTFLLPGWGRFLPIARLLPLCALATALLVQLGVFGLERLRARNLRNRASGAGGGPGRARPPRRPMTPPGQGVRPTNGARTRARVDS
jgi:hypothetical protein